MKIWYFASLVLSAYMLSLTVTTFAQTTFSRDLKLGDRGADVRLLQQILNRDIETRVAGSGIGSPGLESDYFGALTKAAVIKFQYKYRAEVLYPVGLLGSTGYVGSMSRAKLTALAFPNTAQSAPVPGISSPATPTIVAPVVTGVYPQKVRRGDTVTIKGENFTHFGNAVILATGLIKKQYINLPSSDGKTLTFIYDPPIFTGMTESEVLALPAEAVAYLDKTLTDAGGKLSDIWTSNGNITNEAELKEFLERNGHSMDEMYYHYWFRVRNGNGVEWFSDKPLLTGLQAFPFEKITEKKIPFARIKNVFSEIAEALFPKVYATDYGGGLNFGEIMDCDCSSGYIGFMWSFGGEGLGTFMYYYGDDFEPLTIADGSYPNMWLGWFDSLGAPVNCWRRASYICYPVPANEAKSDDGNGKGIGYSFWPSFSF